MTVYVSTCDKYMHLLKGFTYLFNKYWGEDQAVIVLGFAQPPFELPSNFTFHSMEPVETRAWTDNMRDYFVSIEDDHFVFMFDDYWLTEKVNLDEVAEMETFVINGAAKGDLSNNTNYFSHTKRGDYVVADTPAPYRTSTQPAVWSREWLIGILKPGLDPWGFELQGPSSELNGGDIIGKAKSIFDFANVYLKGAPAEYMIDKLTEKDKKALVEISTFDGFGGYLPHIS